MAQVHESRIGVTKITSGFGSGWRLRSPFDSNVSWQLAEKLGVALDCGWRSAGVPSRPALGVMGWSGLPLR